MLEKDLHTVRYLTLTYNMIGPLTSYNKLNRLPCCLQYFAVDLGPTRIPSENVESQLLRICGKISFKILVPAVW